jgi:hypothetical protein
VGTIELSNALGLSKSTVSFLIKKGMPVNSIDSAQAWRETNAKPRAKRGQAGSPPPAVKFQAAKLSAPIEKPEPVCEIPATKEDADNDPRQSLRRARRAEADADRVLQEVKATNVSIEDYRKANAVYVASRNNRNKAEQDFRAWQRDEGITLFVDEAKELFVRPLSVLKQALDSAPKMLGLRCNPQSPKLAEEALTEWIDSVILPKMREALRE